MTTGRRMSAQQRAALIAEMRQEPEVRTSARTRERLSVVAAAAETFDDLPGYAAIRMQQAFAAHLGVANPFYRTHAERAGAYIELDGMRRTNFTSYDYLGLNGHPKIVSAVAEAAERWGTSVSASRLTSGERPFHAALERALAGLYDAQAALTFVSGHATNLAVIGSIIEPGDLVVHDALAHNSIVLGARISGAHRRSFAHNDLEALDDLLAQQRRQFRRCLVITEGLFSMDGDGPDLGRLIEIKRRHGAWLMIDDAHALGVLGRTGRGLAEHAGIDPAEVDIWMGTLSKTLVSCGGYVAGPAALIEFLKYSAPGMVYSVGIPPTATVAASTALDLMLREPGRVEALQANGRRFLAGARAAALDSGSSWGAAVAPVLVGDSLQTVLLVQQLIERGVVAVPVIPPGVPEKLARLRFFLSASHTAADIDSAIAGLVDARRALDGTGITLASAAGEALAHRTAGIPGTPGA